MTNSRQHEMQTFIVSIKTTKDKRMYERYQAIYFYLQGYSKKESTTMIGRSEKPSIIM